MKHNYVNNFFFSLETNRVLHADRIKYKNKLFTGWRESRGGRKGKGKRGKLGEIEGVMSYCSVNGE